MGAEDEVEEFPAKPAMEKKPLIDKELPEGGLMKAIVRAGGGERSPTRGDQVFIHCTTRTAEGVVVDSTRLEYGGKGLPLRRVLGKRKMPRGWDEAIPSMLKGEIAMLKLIPELHYGDPDCKIPVRDDYPKDQLLFFEIELVDFMTVRVLEDDFGVTKMVFEDGESWETPRAPYEVKVWIVGREFGKEPFLKCTEGEPFQFTFGKKEVPAGLERAVGSMVKGEKSTLYISKPYITAGSATANLPLEADELEFEVEMIQIIQIRDVLGDGGVIKRRVQDGRGDFPMDCPLDDSILQIHYKGMLPAEGGRVFYDTRVNNEGQPLTFSSGEGLVPEGLEASCRLMLPGEVALVKCQPQYAYDNYSRMENVPHGAEVLWEVELVGFEKFKDWTGLTFREIMGEVDKFKGTGNRLFKEGRYELARAKYEKLLKEFNHIHPHDDDEGRELLENKIALQLNVAACFHNLHEYVKCIDLCNKVMEENPQHAKAYYRRGLAYTVTGDYEEARADFNKMITLDKSTEAAAKVALAKLSKKQQESEMKARKQFKGLFDKKPGELSQESEINITPTRGTVSQDISEQPAEDMKANQGIVSQELSERPTKDMKADQDNSSQPVDLSERSMLAVAKGLWKKLTTRCSIL